MEKGFYKRMNYHYLVKCDSSLYSVPTEDNSEDNLF